MAKTKKQSNSTSIKIRLWEKNDIDFIISSLKSKNPDDLLRRLHDKDSNCYIALEEGKKSGLILVEKRFFEGENAVFITDITAENMLTRMETAPLLKEAVEKWAKKEGLSAVYATVDPNNDDSLRLIQGAEYSIVRFTFKKEI